MALQKYIYQNEKKKKTRMKMHMFIAYFFILYLYDFRLLHGCCPHTRWNKEKNECVGK